MTTVSERWFTDVVIDITMPPRAVPRHRAGTTRDDAALLDDVPLHLVAHALDSATSTSAVVTLAEGDNPVVWVNRGFTALTGYSRDEVLGRNPRFLQGPHTDRRVVQRVHRRLALGGTVTATVLNYRKDGTPFWNRMVVVPIRDTHGEITHRRDSPEVLARRFPCLT